MDQRSQVLLLLAFIKFVVIAAKTDPNDGMFFGLSSYFGAISGSFEYHRFLVTEFPKLHFTF
jgi:hypothetical protein